MKINEFLDSIESGVKPEVKMNWLIEEYSIDSIERNMVGILSSAESSEDWFKVVLDLNKHEALNKKIGSLSWYDEEDDSLSSWVETEYYPSDGLLTVEIPFGSESPFILI